MNAPKSPVSMPPRPEKQCPDGEKPDEQPMPDNDRMSPDQELPTDDPDIMGGTVP